MIALDGVRKSCIGLKLLRDLCAGGVKLFSVLAFSLCVKLLSVDDRMDSCKSFLCFLSLLRLKALIRDCMMGVSLGAAASYTMFTIHTAVCLHTPLCRQFCSVIGSTAPRKSTAATYTDQLTEFVLLDTYVFVETLQDVC